MQPQTGHVSVEFTPLRSASLVFWILSAIAFLIRFLWQPQNQIRHGVIFYGRAELQVRYHFGAMRDSTVRFVQFAFQRIPFVVETHPHLWRWCRRIDEKAVDYGAVFFGKCAVILLRCGQTLFGAGQLELRGVEKRDVDRTAHLIFPPSSLRFAQHTQGLFDACGEVALHFFYEGFPKVQWDAFWYSNVLWGDFENHFDETIVIFWRR